MENAVNWNSTYTVDGAVVNATVPPMCCKMVDHSKFPGHMAEIKFVDLRGCLEHPREVNTNLEVGGAIRCSVVAPTMQYIRSALPVFGHTGIHYRDAQQRWVAQNTTCTITT